MRRLLSAPLLLISALAIFAPLHEGGTTHLAVMIIRLLILALLVVFMAEGIRSGRIQIPVLPIGYAVVAFLALASLATLISPYSHPGRQWLLILAGYVAFLYLLVSFVSEWDHVRALASVIVFMGIGEAVWTIVQGAVWRMSRPSGTFFNPNFLAGYLTVTWSLLLSHLLYRRRRMSVSVGFIGQVLGLVGSLSALTVLLAAAILTQSRGGILALFVATVCVLAVRFGLKAAGACGVLLVLVGLILPTPVRERVVVEHHENPVAYARWQMWKSAVQQMIDHPLGIGLGLYQYTSPRYAFPVDGEITRYGKVAQTAHNEYLQIGVEMGPMGILVFALGIGLTGRATVRVLQRRLSRRQRSLVVGLTGGTLALLVHAACDSNLREPAIAILLILSVGLTLAAARLTDGATRSFQIIPVHSRIVWGVGTVGVALIIAVEVLRLGVAWMLFESGSRHAADGQTALAIERLQTACALDPGKTLYHHGLGSMYAKQFEATGDVEMFQKARAEFQEAMRINPLDARLPALLGHLYVTSTGVHKDTSTFTEQQIQRLRAALQAYDQATKLAPFAATYRYEQARLSWLLGDRREAERRAKEAQMLEPNFLPARALLVRLFLEEGQMSEARNELQEIQARQERYKGWLKNGLEQRFLTVDVTSMRAAVEKKEKAG
jgi:O-antigen ligase/Tfp pilus assembly protein PilF